MNTEKYTDEHIVKGIISNDEQIIEHFFYQKCSPLFAYIIRNIFDSRVNKDELISELYLYLSDNDWHKVRQYDFRSKLMTWISVVTSRYFQKKRDELIENQFSNTLYNREEIGYNSNSVLERNMDIQNALSQMTNMRYRKVIEELDLQEKRPEELASEMGITVGNLYNIRRRAHLQLATIMKRKDDYYD